jgi:hypothetical protein
LAQEVPTLDLEQVEGTTKSMLAVSKSSQHSDFGPHVEMVDRLAAAEHVRGLPLLMGDDCTSGQAFAKQREKLSVYLRRSLFLGAETKAEVKFERLGQFGSDYDYFEGQSVRGEDSIAAEFQKPEQVAIFEQLFQVESGNHRDVLINLLGQIEGPQATQALARRALFDVDPAIRTAARRALQGRDSGAYRQIVARGLKYPWAPIAREAQRVDAQMRAAAVAETTTSNMPAEPSTNQRVGDLSTLLTDSAHVSKPYRAPLHGWVVDELVKVNHLRNCVMCHAVSHDPNDPMRGPIPTPGQKLPQVYYSERSRGDFVRADVVYLRQDFSVMLPVEDADPWPVMQRFDFFVRTRPATAEELAGDDRGRLRQSPLLERRAREELASFLLATARGASDLVALVSNRSDADTAR